MSLKKILSMILVFSIILASFTTMIFADELDGELLEEVEGKKDVDENVDKEILDDQFAGGDTFYVEADEVVSDEKKEMNFITDKTPYTKPVNVLSALNIMRGKTDYDFAPDDYLTKAEMCAIATRFLGMADVALSVDESQFADVGGKHWAKDYIEMAFDMGLVDGNGDGTFSPDEYLTAEQAVKILVCALGYEPKAEEMGGYPVGYLSVAAQLGLLKGVDITKYTDSIERWKIATIVYNALDADLMEVKSYGDRGYSSISNDITALKQYHKTEKKKGIVEGVYQGSFENKNLQEGEVIIDGVIYKSPFDLNKYLGLKIEFYCTKVDGSDIKEIIVFLPEFDITKTETIDFEDISAVDVSADFDVEIKYYNKQTDKLKALDFKNPVIMYNGVEESFETPAHLKTLFDNYMEQGQIRYIKNTKGEHRDVIFIENYRAYVVERTDAENDRIYYFEYLPTGFDVKVMDVSTDGDNIQKVFYYDEDGNPTNIAGLTPNSAITVYESLDKSIYNIYSCDNEVSGKILSSKKVKDAKEDISEERELESLYNIDINDPVVIHAINGSDGNWNYTGYATTSDGEIFDVCGYPAWGRLNVNTGYKDVSTLPDGIKEVPENTGNNVFYLSRHKQGVNNNRYPVNSTGMKISGDFSDIKAGDRIRISTWVYTDTIKGYINGSTDPIEIDNQETVTSSINIQIDRPLKRTAMSVITENVPNRVWTKVSGEFDIKHNDDILAIGILGNGTNYAWDTYYTGLTIEKIIGGVDEESIISDNNIYEFNIDGKKYKNVNTLNTTRIKIGEKITFVLDNNNRIVGYKIGNEASNYGILMDVAVVNGPFGDNLVVNILGEDGKIKKYETREKIKAYNGVTVSNVLATALVTNVPINIKTDHYLWSTNNASNFVQTERVWLSDEEKSKAACRKMVYYETDENGLIKTILVPSVPEEDKECKLTMVHNYDDGELIHAINGRWFVYSKGAGKDDLVHYVDNNAKVFEVFPMNYDENDYSALPHGMTDISEANLIGGMEWKLAQLYQYPGSERVNFVVINPFGPYSEEIKTVAVKGVNQTIEGYNLEGYINGELVEIPIKPDTRLMENIWVSDLDNTIGKIITNEDLAELAHDKVKPYNVAYESDFMGNQENPYIDNNSLKQGDIVEIVVRDNEIVYLAIVRRRDTGIFSKYSVSDPTGSLYSFMRGTSAVRGEVVDIDLDINIITVKGYYWPGTVAVPGLEEYSQSASPITEFTSIIGVAYTTPIIYDLSNDKCYLGTTADFEVGDEIISYSYSGLPSYVFIFKNN